ncbi:MAG TPA: hypothetical protein VFN22_04790 [Gemmatimonadales bacterium]|nr:hypothetical protein [Gemmatimonadales bacterium]
MSVPTGRAPAESPNPLGDAAATEDQVPVAVRAMGAGAAAAVCWVALVIWVALLTIEPGGGPHALENFDPDATYANIMLFGLLPTPLVAGFSAWALMSRIRDSWRRGGLAMVAVLGGTVVAMITTFVARQAFGRHALLVLAVLALFLALRLGRSALAATARLSASS